MFSGAPAGGDAVERAGPPQGGRPPLASDPGGGPEASGPRRQEGAYAGHPSGKCHLRCHVRPRLSHLLRN
eukprot:1179400-Prorocentrum_minimum.AAC.1